MPATPHLAILIGPRAATLREVLPNLRAQLRCRSLTDVFALADDSSIEEADSIWIDASAVDERGFGALLFAQRLRPDAKRILLVSVADNGDRSVHDARARLLDAHLVEGRPDSTSLRRILSIPSGEESENDESVYAGIADQLANPLAALAARLQLCEIALQSRASVDFEDNLALARETTDRMTKNLEKLRMMTSRGPGTRAAHGIYALLNKLRASAVFGEASAAIELPETSEDLEIWVDLGLFEQALTGLLRTSLDLSSGGISTAAHARGDYVLAEVRFETPRELPRDCPDLFAPFAALPLLRDPDLGLDLALTRGLVRGCGGNVRALRHSGFLEGFALEIPRAKHGEDDQSEPGSKTRGADTLGMTEAEPGAGS